MARGDRRAKRLILPRCATSLSVRPSDRFPDTFDRLRRRPDGMDNLICQYVVFLSYFIAKLSRIVLIGADHEFKIKYPLVACPLVNQVLFGAQK